MHRNIGRSVLAGFPARLKAGDDKSALRLREKVLLATRVILIIITLIAGQLPIRVAEGRLSPTTRFDTSNYYNLPDLEHFLGDPASHLPFTVEITESDHQRQTREAEAEKQRQLAKARESHTPVRYAVNGFAAGNCTAYVATRFPVAWSGNAIAWSANARTLGYRVDKIPESGAILQTTENSWRSKGAGHVAYIDAVIDGQIYVSEQNYEGWGVVSHRVLPIDSPLIAWVIHPI